MSPAAHTPRHTEGPWIAEDGITPGRRVVAPNAPKTRRVVAHLGGKDREANSALVAAGPDMLVALKAVHEPYRHLTAEALKAGILMEFGPPKPEKGAALLLARAAIARAGAL